MRAWLVLTAALVAAAATPARADNEPRVLVIPVKGEAPKKLGALVADVEQALSDGAQRTTPNVSRATASLDDTAVIVGCDPAEQTCLDQVAAALNVDQMLIADVSIAGEDASVNVTAATREADPVHQQFTIHAATRAADLRTLEEAVPGMLEAGEAHKADAQHHTETPPPPPPPPPPVVATHPASDRRPFYLIGAGGGLAAVGGVFWLLASSKQHDIDAAPTRTAADLDRLASLEDEAKLRANLGNGLVIGGAVVAVAGVTWWLLERRGHHEVAIAPAPAPGGGSVTIGGRW